MTVPANEPHIVHIRHSRSE